MWNDRTLRVAKVVTKVSLRQPMGAGLMLKDLAYLGFMGPGAEQVNTRYGQNCPNKSIVYTAVH